MLAEAQSARRSCGRAHAERPFWIATLPDLHAAYLPVFWPTPTFAPEGVGGAMTPPSPLVLGAKTKPFPSMMI
jgi:hypothetical protein